jgi:hypothetical protein
MKYWIAVVLAGLILCWAAMPALAQTVTDPNPPSTAQLEITANTAFNRGQYAKALPIYKKLVAIFKSEPTRAGAMQEKIRVCEKAIEAAKKDPAATQPAAPNLLLPTDIPMSAETRKPHPAPKPGQLLEMSIKELGNFEYDQDKGGNIPADVVRLNGSRIRLRGFMIPMDQAENITQFALVPSLFSCCFGQPPQIQHTIVANCPKGKAVGYVPDEIVVEGNLHVEEKKDDGYIVSIFEVGVTSVKPAPK